MGFEWDVAAVQRYFTILGIVMVTGLVLFLLMMAVVWRRLKNIDLPEDAGFVETIRVVPLLLVLALDVLDLSLDIFATPVVWVMLGQLKLTGLRGVSAVEAFIPGTQFLPTLTVAWIGIRIFRIGE